VHFWTFSVAILTVLAGSCGLAGAQDFSAGKTAAQLFASDCSACHKSPAGLAKGQSAGALASFLREHYTTKPESASALAAYVAAARGSAPAAAAPKPDDKPAPKPPRPVTTAVEQGEPTAPAAPREAAKPSVDPVVAKLNFYGGARGEPKDTARSAGSANKLESYANSGTGADAVAPDDPKRKPADKKKKDNTTASTGEAAAAPHAPARPRRPPAPATPAVPDRQ
jgi:hypothetical protein